MDICVAVPLHNSGDWLTSFEPLPEYRYVFFDNASTDQTRELLDLKGFNYSYSDKFLSREDSWSHAYQIATGTNSKWIKPQFAGDFIQPGLTEIMRPYKNEGVVLFNYLVKERWKLEHRARTWRQTGNLILDTALNGPFSGPPLAMIFARDDLKNVLDSGYKISSPWLADFELFSLVAQEGGYQFCEFDVGLFDKSQRLTFRVLSKSVDSLREELKLMRKSRLELVELNCRQKIIASKRVIDLGFHRLPQKEAVSLLTGELVDIWRP